jgi:AraC-like DNA-binding protein
MALTMGPYRRSALGEDAVTLVRTTDGVHPSRRFTFWREVIAETYMSVDMSRPNADDPFDGAIEILPLGAVELSRMTVHGSRIARRLSTHIARSQRDVFFLTMPLHHTVHYLHCGREIDLGANSFCLVDANRPAAVAYPEEHRLINVAIPGVSLRSRLGAPEDYCGLPIRADCGAAGVAKALILTVLEQAGAIGRQALVDFGEIVIDVVALALQSQPGPSPRPPRSVRWAHLWRARRYVEDHLPDSDLGPTQIAAELGVSVRYLGRIFKLSGRTVGDWILERRLERCRRALSSAALAHRSISEIAYGAGFGDAAHFSRSFRRRFGASPRDYRAAAGRDEAPPLAPDPAARD